MSSYNFSGRKEIKKKNSIFSFEKSFLLTFTKGLIENYGPGEFFKLKEFVFKAQNREVEIKSQRVENIRERIRSNELEMSIIGRNLSSFEKIQPKRNEIKSEESSRKKIPFDLFNLNRNMKFKQLNLPSQFDYLKPIIQNRKIDLGKINSLLNNPQVQEVESNGVGTSLIVRGSMGAKKVNFALTKDEIKKIVDSFSERTKIPIQEGFNRIVFGNLLLVSVSSELLGQRFVIKKLRNNSPLLRR